jgi:hypothetical protein
MQTMALKLGISIAAGLGFLALAENCRAADTAVGLDLDYVHPLGVEGSKSGSGFMLRLGKEIDSGPLTTRGELGFAYHSFGGDFEPRLYRGVVGLRLGFGEIFRPSVFGHVGVGRATYDDVLAPGASHTGLTYDLGAALDFVLLPLLNVGVHGAYNGLTGNDDVESLKWLTLGVHGELIF